MRQGVSATRAAGVPADRPIARERARQAASGLMALALAASPAYVLRPHLGPVPTTALELVLLVGIAAGLYAYWGELPWRSPYLWPSGSPRASR